MIADIQRSNLKSETIYRGTFSVNPAVNRTEPIIEGSKCEAVFHEVITIAGKQYFNVSSNYFVKGLEERQITSEWMMMMHGNYLYVPSIHYTGRSIYDRNVIRLEEPAVMIFADPSLGTFWDKPNCKFDQGTNAGYVKRNPDE